MKNINLNLLIAKNVRFNQEEEEILIFIIWQTDIIYSRLKLNSWGRYWPRGALYCTIENDLYKKPITECYFVKNSAKEVW